MGVPWQGRGVSKNKKGPAHAHLAPSMGQTNHKASSNVESWLAGLGGRGGGVASAKTKWVPPAPTWPPLWVEPLFGVADIVPMLLLRSVWWGFCILPEADRGAARYGGMVGAASVPHPGLLLGAVPSLTALRFSRGGGGYLCPEKSFLISNYMNVYSYLCIYVLMWYD